MEEERGVAYRLQLPNNAQSVLIGVKLYGGLYCNKCEVSLLEDGEDGARCADKQHVEQCPLCGDNANDNNADITPCQCFDWRMAPHRLQSNKLRALNVVDTFGGVHSVDMFLQQTVNDSCPIQLYDRIAQQ